MGRCNWDFSLTASQGILESLFEAKELKDRQVDSRVESETALVGAQSRVELNTETTVDVELALVVLPDNTELNDTFGDGADLESGAVFGVLLEEGRIVEGADKL